MPFIRHKQRAITAVSPVKGQGRWINPSKGRSDIDVFVDGGAAGPGDGSMQDPYNNFDQINIDAAAGDLDGQTIGLKRGSIIYPTAGITGLELNNTTGVTVKPYGQGANPIIDKSVPEGTAADWAEISPNVYERISTTGARNLLVDGVNMTYRNSSGSDFASNDAAAAAADDCCYATGASGNAGATRVFSTSVDMTAAVSIRGADTVSSNRCVRASASNDFTMIDIDTQMSSNKNVEGLNQPTNYHVNGGHHRWCGVNGSTGDLISIDGIDSSNMATGTIIENCELNGTTHASAGNAIEFKWVEGAIIRDIVMHDIIGNGVEYFEECNNCLVDRVLAYDMWVQFHRPFPTNPSSGNVFRCVALSGTRNWKNTASDAGATFANLQDATGTRFINCSVYLNNKLGVWMNGVSGTAQVMNCIFEQSHAQADSAWWISVGNRNSSEMAGTDYNNYFLESGTRRFQEQGASIGLAAWQATVATPDLNSVEADPNFVDAAPGLSPPNLRLTAGTAAALQGDATDPDAPTVDITGKAYTVTGGRIDAGAYSFT